MFSRSDFADAGHEGHVISNLSDLEGILELLPE
jgi:hypothetical protein